MGVWRKRDKMRQNSPFLLSRFILCKVCHLCAFVKMCETVSCVWKLSIKTESFLPAASCTNLGITYNSPLDRVHCLCSSVCHTHLPSCWVQSCATMLKLHLDICQNALFQVTVQLFSSSCTDILPCCLQHLHTADPDLLIPPCCYRIWFSVCPSKDALFLRRSSQFALGVVCPRYGVQACSCSTIFTSVMVLLFFPVNCHGFLRYCFVIVFVVCATIPIKITQSNKQP